MEPLTVKEIVQTMRELVHVSAAGNSTVQANGQPPICTGGILLHIMADAIPQVVAMKMPGAGQMASEFCKIFKGLKHEDALIAAQSIISNNDSHKFDKAFTVLEHLMEKYPNEIVEKAIPGYYDRPSDMFNQSLEEELKTILKGIK